MLSKNKSQATHKKQWLAALVIGLTQLGLKEIRTHKVCNWVENMMD